MPDGPPAVTFEGLADFQRDLRAVGGRVDAEVDRAETEAAQLVAAAARYKAISAGGVLALVAPSITASGPSVSLGGPRFPMGLGAEFGAKAFAQFKPWRGNDHARALDPGSTIGYAMYPALRDKDRDVDDRFDAALDRVMRHAFPER